MKDLTGLTRFTITREWIKRGRPGNREDFVRVACQHMGLRYRPPREYVRSLVKKKEIIELREFYV